MPDYLEQCKFNWADGTCPQCGEPHYLIVRREQFLNLKTELAHLQELVDVANRCIPTNERS